VKSQASQAHAPVDVFDVKKAEAALRRAAALARKTAIETNTHLVVMREGKLVHISAQQLREQQQTSSVKPGRERSLTQSLLRKTSGKRVLRAADMCPNAYRRWANYKACLSGTTAETSRLTRPRLPR